MKLNLNNAVFLISAVNPKQYPANGLPEIALAGRSNVGKSSLINRLAGRKSLARTSSEPGKTATINFYDMDGAFTFVDLPGYGYAKVSQAERERWAQMINTYLNGRQNLIQVLQLVDARHRPTKDDEMMFRWIVESGYQPIVIATKLDKLKKSQVDASIALIKEVLDTQMVFPFSAQTGAGKDEVWEMIFGLLGVNDDEAGAD